MFRRHWSGLPADAAFPCDLAGLGYFVNEQDEVRSVEDPSCYFRFFCDRNPRINERKCFAFNRAIESEVHARLEREGLDKVALPLGATLDDRHVPIFVSRGLAARTRVVVFFGEPTQDLGVLAGRVANGRGGIDKGSFVSVVRALRAQPSSPVDPAPPGVVLANTGQLHWWPEGRRALTVSASVDVPLPSLVHRGRCRVPALNAVPGHEDPASHIGYVFGEVLRTMTRADCMVSVVAVGQSCDMVASFLDKAEHWAAWGHRLSSMLLLGDVYPCDGLTNPAFRAFLATRTRAYATSREALDTPLAPPTGNPTEHIPNLGCPCYSSAEPMYIELVLIRALAPALAYMAQVATTPGFANPPVVVSEKPGSDAAQLNWVEVPDAAKPDVSIADKDLMEAQRRRLSEA